MEYIYDGCAVGDNVGPFVVNKLLSLKEAEKVY